MSNKNILQTLELCCSLTAFLFTGCSEHKPMPKGEIDSIRTDSTLLLKAGSQESPTCEVKIDFNYLRPYSEQDSISKRINRHLQRIAFGTDYVNCEPEEAVSGIRDRYLRDYRKELLPYYEADLKSGKFGKECPPWYNYSYEITSKLEYVHDSILNYAVTLYEYTGGAHPNSYITWNNINAHTGHLITKKDIFKDGFEKDAVILIMKQLLAEANRRLKTDTISCVAGLQENGLLTYEDLYVSDNFLITEKGISFLYNNYEIGPYVMGHFQLDVPYQEIEYLMKMK